MEFKDAAERRAWLLARVEEVEQRRNARSKIGARRSQLRNNRVKVRAFVQTHPGSTISQIADAVGLTQDEVWETRLQREFIQTNSSVKLRGQTRWWPKARRKAENDQVV